MILLEIRRSVLNKLALKQSVYFNATCLKASPTTMAAQTATFKDLNPAFIGTTSCASARS